MLMQFFAEVYAVLTDRERKERERGGTRKKKRNE
jgi:hypothetical protein